MELNGRLCMNCVTSFIKWFNLLIPLTYPFLYVLFFSSFFFSFAMITWLMWAVEDFMAGSVQGRGETNV